MPGKVANIKVCSQLKRLHIKSGLTFDFQTNNMEGTHTDNQSRIGFSLLGGVDLNLSESIRF